MAKRRNTAKDELADLLGGLLGLGALALVGYVFVQTESFYVAGAVLVFLMFTFWVIGELRRQFRNERLRRSGITEIDQMSGDQFERFLEQLFKAKGYKAEKTKASGDFGADVILVKDHLRIVIQAKRYSKNVSLKAVQEAVAAQAHYKAQEAWVVTNSYFTDPAIKLAKSNGVKLIDRDELVEVLLEGRR